MLVGWAVSAVNDRHLAMRALEMAVKRRCPGAGLLHHTDRGSPETSNSPHEEHFRAGTSAMKCRPSRSRRAA
jgi:putative transposase